MKNLETPGKTGRVGRYDIIEIIESQKAMSRFLHFKS